MRASWSLLLLVLLVVPAASAGISLPNRHFEDQVAFSRFQAGSDVSFVSGKFQADTIANGATQGFLNITGTVQVTGIERVCWSGAVSNCATGSANLRVVIEDGQSFGFRVPGQVTTSTAAESAVAVFVDFGDNQALSDLKLGKSIVSLLSTSRIDVDFPPVPVNTDTFPNVAVSNGAVLKTVDGSTMHVYQGTSSSPLHTVSSDQDYFMIQGQALQATPIHAESVVLAFDTDSEAKFGRAGADAIGFSEALGRLNDVLAAVGGETSTNDNRDLGPLEPVVGALFSSAYGSLPANDGSDVDVRNMTIVRFASLTATRDGQGVQLEASAPLIIDHGKVKGAQGLVGAWYIMVPWWTLVFWVLAIAAVIVRFALKAPKQNERWDRFNWIGRVAGIAASILVFVLWDREVRDVFGTSLLSGAGGTALIFVALLQFLYLGGLTILAQRPLKLIFDNGLRIGRQGKFMGLGAPVAILIGYFLTAPLLLAYLQLAFKGT